MNFDIQFDPYNRNYVVTTDVCVTTEVSPELAEALMKNPEEKKTLAKEIHNAILAVFRHTRVIHREDSVQEVMDPTKVHTR